jgi:hypothetical protein
MMCTTVFQVTLVRPVFFSIHNINFLSDFCPYFKITSDIRNKTQLSDTKSTSCISKIKAVKKCKTLNVANFVCVLKHRF